VVEVRAVEGVTVGDPCTLEASLHPAWSFSLIDDAYPGMISLRCGEIYIHATRTLLRAPNYANFWVGEEPGEVRGTYRHAIHLNNRFGNSHVYIDTWDREGHVTIGRLGGAAEGHVMIRFDDTWGPSIAAAPLLLRTRRAAKTFASPQFAQGSRLGAKGKPDGTRCDVHVTPLWDTVVDGNGGPNCQVHVRCERPDATGSTSMTADLACTSESPLRGRSTESGSEGRHEEAALDFGAGTLSLRQSDGQKPRELRIRLDRFEANSFTRQ
jgi:hypothetical protein